MNKRDRQNNFQDKINDAFREENFKEIGEIIGEGIDTAIDVTKDSIKRFVNKNKVQHNLPYSVQNDDRIINQNPKTVKRVKHLGSLAKTSIVCHLIALFWFLMDMFDTYGSIREDLPALIFWIIPALVISFYANYRKERYQEIEDKNNIELADELAEKVKKEVTELTEIATKVSGPMEEKIKELLQIVGKIFELLRENPNTAKDLSKAINYYLPTTVKLANSYIKISEKPTESVKSSLLEIENTMDTVNDAFLKILDNLYEEKIMDISSDMSVLKSMLRQEGLLDEDEFKIGG